MAIFRELLVRIGFNVDKKQVQNVDKTIKGFAFRFGAAASAANLAFSKTLDFFSQLSDNILNTSDASKKLGISFTDLYKLQKAASEFRLKDTDLISALEKANTLIEDAKSGFGSLKTLAREVGIELSPNENSESLFFKILQAYGKIENEVVRIQKISEVFGSASAVQLSNISQDLDSFKKISDSYSQQSLSAQNSVKAFEGYERNLTKLNNQLDGIKGVLASVLVGLTNSFDKFFTKIGETLEKITGSNFGQLLTKFTEFNDSVKKLVDSFEDSAFDFAPTVLRTIGGDRPGLSALNQLGAPPALTINNNLNFEVPNAPTEETANYISQKVSDEVEQAFFDQFQVIQNNNTQVE